MKRMILAAAAALTLFGSLASAQVSFKPYGFFRSYAIFDSRATKSLSEDLFFFVPLDENKVGDNDVNAVSNFNFQAITSRMGVDVTGYEIGGMKVTGKIEGDFYCLNSTGNTGTLRMRQAYFDLIWSDRGKHQDIDYSLRIGQGWHPMAADMAHGINLETAAPFSPFNRSAMLLLNATLDKKVTFTAGLIEQLQYRSSGPNGGSNQYQRHAIPEIYLGVSLADGPFLGRIGADILSLRPHYGYNTAGQKYDEWFTTVSPFLYLQYTFNPMFQVKAKTTLSQAAEYMQMNSGYAVTGVKNDGISNEYSPMRTSSSFISAQWGKKVQLLGMVGYIKALGSSKDITGPIYFSANGFTSINQILRLTPTVAYNLGKLQFALEYDFTNVQYGDASNLDSKGLPMHDDLHWVANHRLVAMAKFTF